MTWQGDEVRVSDMAQGQPSLRAEFQLSRHITSQLMPLQYAMSSSSMLCIPPPPLQVFLFIFIFIFIFSSPSDNPISFSYHGDLKDKYHNIRKD